MFLRVTNKLFVCLVPDYRWVESVWSVVCYLESTSVLCVDSMMMLTRVSSTVINVEYAGRYVYFLGTICFSTFYPCVCVCVYTKQG